MSKYHDDTTVASLPGRLPLSQARLEELEPELFTQRTFKCGPTCDVDHPALEMRERLEEHLQLGCCCPAKVVSLVPLVIAAQADDLDAVVLLTFPLAFVDRYKLEVGTRLLAVNTYGDMYGVTSQRLFFAADIVPGPKHTNRWSTYKPLIADFLCDDRALVEERKRQIPESEWASVDPLARLRIERLGLDTARSGKPTRAGFPTRTRGDAYFEPFEVVTAPTVSSQQAPTRSRTLAIVAVVVAVAAVLALLLRG